MNRVIIIEDSRANEDPFPEEFTSFEPFSIQIDKCTSHSGIIVTINSLLKNNSNEVIDNPKHSR